MTAQLRPIFNLQQLDSRLKALDNQAAQDDGSAELTRKVAAREKKLESLCDQRGPLKIRLKDVELKLASVTANLEEFEKKLYGGKTTNPKELSGFAREIEQLKGQKDKLETQALELMEQIEKLDGEIDGVEKALERARTGLSEMQEKTAQARAQLEKQRGEIQRRRDILAGEIDDTLIARYELLRKRREGVAVSHMLGNACGECGANLPDSVRQRAHERELEICSNCERILYTE